MVLQSSCRKRDVFCADFWPTVSKWGGRIRLSPQSPINQKIHSEINLRWKVSCWKRAKNVASGQPGLLTKARVGIADGLSWKIRLSRITKILIWQRISPSTRRGHTTLKIVKYCLCLTRQRSSYFALRIVRQLCFTCKPKMRNYLAVRLFPPFQCVIQCRLTSASSAISLDKSINRCRKRRA